MLLEPEDLHALTLEVMVGAARASMAGAATESGDHRSRAVGVVAALEGGYDPAPDRPGRGGRLTGIGGDRRTPLTNRDCPVSCHPRRASAE